MSRDFYTNAENIQRIADALVRIADSLETVIDEEKQAVRTFDIERGKVYSTHLGKGLRPESP